MPIDFEVFAEIGEQEEQEMAVWEGQENKKQAVAEDVVVLRQDLREPHATRQDITLLR